MVTQTRQPVLELLFGLSKAGLGAVLERGLERLTAGAKNPENIAQEYRASLDAFARETDKIREVLEFAASDDASLDSKSELMILEGIKNKGLAGIVEIDVTQAASRFGYGGGPMQEWSPQYILGIKAVITAFLPDRNLRYSFDPRYLPLRNHGFLEIAEGDIQPSRNIITDKGLVADRLSAAENYVAALSRALEEKIVRKTDSGIELQPHFDAANCFGMNYIGVAKGLEVIAEHGNLDAERKQHALAMAKECYINSGLAPTLLVSSKLFELGDPQSIEYVQIPLGMFDDFRGWVDSGMPGRKQE